MTDENLIALFVNGDESAFNTLYQRYRRQIYSYINRMLPGNHSVADDVFQQTWVRIISKLPKYHERGNFLAWCLRIAHNLVVDHWRRERLRTNLDDAEEFVDPALSSVEEHGRREVYEQLERAIAKLDHAQREVVQMRRHGITFAEIAKLQRVGINTALARMHYAIRNLRTLMTAELTLSGGDLE